MWWLCWCIIYISMLVLVRSVSGGLNYSSVLCVFIGGWYSMKLL